MLVLELGKQFNEMRKYQVVSALIITILFACKKEAVQNQSNNQTTSPSVLPQETTVKTSTILIDPPGISSEDMGTALERSIPGTTLYVQNNEENIIIAPTLFYNEPLIPAIHLKRKNNEWTYIGNYPEAAMGCGRDSKLLDNNGTLVFADHGIEPSQGTWPFGNILIAKTSGEKLNWTTISKDRSFYHSISTGDLNNDGLTDIVGLHMGTKGTWIDNLHTYIQKANGRFEADKNMISYNNWLGAYGAGAVLIANILGDARPEIIRSDYRVFPAYPSMRYSFVIFSFSSTTGKYEFAKTPGVFGFASTDFGATSMKAVDFDKDGDLDIALAYEGNQTNGVEIWTNNGNGDYTFSNQRLEYKFNELQFREFEIADINNDGWQDIVLNGWGGNLFKSDYNKGEVLLNNLVWKNTRGIFEKISTPYRVALGQMPNYVKAFIVNNKLKFIGIRGRADGRLIINDISPVF